MLKMPRIFALLFLLYSFSSKSQVLESYTFHFELSPQQVDSFYTANGLPSIILPQQFGVKIYSVVYNTVSYDGVTPTIASGLVTIPVNKTCASPIISYQHGTILKKTDAPSYLLGEYIIAVAMAADGYVGVMPDYLGLGVSPGIHPYIHAQSEATAVVDMLRAARELCDLMDAELNGQVFLTGYSQGGHATMAAHQYIHENLSQEFNVTASAPMSGPYSLYDVMTELILSDAPYSNPAYLPMIIMTYREVYNLYPNLSDGIISPYDVLLPDWISGLYSSSQIDFQMNQMGANPPKLILQPAVLDSFIVDTLHPMRIRLKENDVYKWVPEVPVKFLYCMGDEQVAYQNSEVAFNYMTQAGAQQVYAEVVDSTLVHFDSALYAIVNMRGFFEPMRHDKIQIFISDYQPATGAQSQNGSVTVSIVGGLAPFQINWSNGETGPTAVNLSPGNHTVSVTGAEGCIETLNITMNIGFGIADEMMTENGLLFPNPATEWIRTKQAVGVYSIKDVYGRTVKNGTNTTENEMISISELASGIYFFVSENNKTRFVKQ